MIVPPLPGFGAAGPIFCRIRRVFSSAGCVDGPSVVRPGWTVLEEGTHAGCSRQRCRRCRCRCSGFWPWVPAQRPLACMSNVFVHSLGYWYAPLVAVRFWARVSVITCLYRWRAARLAGCCPTAALGLEARGSVLSTSRSFVCVDHWIVSELLWASFGCFP